MRRPSEAIVALAKASRISDSCTRALGNGYDRRTAACHGRVGSKPHGLALLIQPDRVGCSRFDDSLECLRRPGTSAN